MEIFIKSSTETKKAIQVQPSDNILKVKEIIADCMSVPVSSQRIIFSGKVLKDTDVLESVGITDGQTLHLVRSIPPPAATQNATSSQSPQQESVKERENDGASGGGFPSTSSAFLGGLPTPLDSSSGQVPGLDLNNPMIQSMLSNPDLIRQTSQMLASNPELINMAMRMGQQGGNPMTFQNPASMQAAMQAFNDPTFMQQMMSIMNSSFGSGGAGMVPQNSPFGNASQGSGEPANNTGPSANTNIPPPEVRFQAQLAQLTEMGLFDADANIRALLATGGNVQAAIEYLFSHPPSGL